MTMISSILMNSDISVHRDFQCKSRLTEFQGGKYSVLARKRQTLNLVVTNRGQIENFVNLGKQPRRSRTFFIGRNFADATAVA